MHGMMEGAFAGAVIGMVVMLVCLAIAFSRRGSVRTNRIGRRVLELQVPAAPAEALARLLTIAPPYRVDDHAAGSHLAVLSVPPTFTTWGFFFPVEIAARPGGGSTLRIGIQSKVFQWGPLVTRAHKKCVEAIEAHLGAPRATLAAG